MKYYFKRIYNKFKYKKQYTTLLTSFILIILVLIMINLVGHVVISEITEREVKQSNERLVSQIKNICDDHLEGALNAANKMINSQSVNALASNRNISAEKENLLVKNVISEALAAKSSNKIITNMYIIFNQRDLCITDETKCNTEILYQIGFSNHFHSKEEMLESFLTSKPKEFRVLKNNNEEKLLMLYSFNIYKGTYYRDDMPIVVLEIDMNNLIKNQNKNITGDFTLVFDNSDTFLSESNVDYAGYIKDGISEYRNDKKSYLINYVRSRIFDGNYVHTIEKSLYAKTSRVINRIIVLSFIVCLMVGIFMAFILAGRNYISISRLIDKLEMDEREFKKNKDYVFQMYLSSILNGSAECTAHELAKHLPAFRNKNYAIVLFNIKEFGICDDNAENHDMTLLSISNVFSELVCDFANSYYCFVDGVYVCILNFNDNFFYSDTITDKIRYTNDFLNKHLGILFEYVLSEMTDKPEEIHTVYKNALKTITQESVFYDEGAENEDINIDNRCNLIINYIGENYSNANFGVNEIAEHFGFSVNYISKYFKDHTGTGLAKYIIYKRIEKAKEKLVESDDLIQNIAEAVGFYSANVFIRTFKKIEGMTPGKYREDNVKNKS